MYGMIIVYVIIFRVLYVTFISISALNSALYPPSTFNARWVASLMWILLAEISNSGVVFCTLNIKLKNRYSCM